MCFFLRAPPVLCVGGVIKGPTNQHRNPWMLQQQQHEQTEYESLWRCLFAVHRRADRRPAICVVVGGIGSGGGCSVVCVGFWGNHHHHHHRLLSYSESCVVAHPRPPTFRLCVCSRILAGQVTRKAKVSPSLAHSRIPTINHPRGA